ncbi:hypothetical protein [Trinickia mobilis]|uniref:hypothetical protein n=1 Tax=Trinickia mobilis TaxID=2816356 RepID=UPI001A8E88F5|nr:hypothetical protein [Trinickia mobilis]
MSAKTFEHNGTTVSLAELVSPRQLKDFAEAHGMGGADARRFAQEDWTLHSITSQEMLDAIAATQTQAEMQLMPLRGVTNNFGVMVHQVGHHQYRFALPLCDSAGQELVSTLVQTKAITITWHAVRGGSTQKTKHQLPSESLLALVEICQRELTNSAGLEAKTLATALDSLTAKEFIPSLIDGVSVKAVYVAMVYERDQFEVIADSFV